MSGLINFIQFKLHPIRLNILHADFAGERGYNDFSLIELFYYILFFFVIVTSTKLLCVILIKSD